MNAPNQNPQSFSLAKRAKSFGYAGQGIRTLLATQHNAWVHLCATFLVAVLGITLRLQPQEWCIVVLTTVVVWSAEALNTALEFLTDLASPDFHPLAKKAKDVAAGAVLIAASGAVIIGLLIFGPKLLAAVQQ